MVRLVSANVLLALLLSVSAVSAGPSCARKNRGSKDCVARCRSHFGWPGKGMGTNPWGSVMDPNSGHSSDEVVSSACGSATSSQIPQATQPAQAPGSDPATVIISSSSAVETSSATSTTVSSSSSKSTISSSSTRSGAQFAPGTRSATSIVSTSTTKSRLTTIRTTSSSPPPVPTTSTKAPETTKAPQTTTKATTTKAPVTSSTAASNSGGSSSGSTSGSDIDRFLAAHNSVRAQHGASALTWDQSLADAASKWANGCLFKHSGGSVGPFGENLAAGTSSNYSPEDGIKQWADEAKDYNPASPTFSHFTQMVWKSTTKLGCVLIRCPALKFEDGSSWGNSGYLVCEYSPQGNVLGQFDQNVQA